MIEFICFLIFVGILVVFWGIAEEEKENILEKKEKNTKKTPKNAVTFEIESTKSQGNKENKTQEQPSIISPNNTFVLPQQNYLEELLTTDLDIKGNLFAQKLRLKQGGNITERNRNAGIYAIFCEINNRVYIGSSINLYARMKQHLAELRKKQHHSYRLQEDFDKFGEYNFSFWVLEED